MGPAAFASYTGPTGATGRTGATGLGPTGPRPRVSTLFQVPFADPKVAGALWATGSGTGTLRVSGG